MCNTFEALERPFPSSTYIFDTSSEIIGEIVRRGQKLKIIKNANFDENLDIPQTSKMYSQIAQRLLYKIREYGDHRTVFSNFFIDQKKSKTAMPHFGPL